MSTSTNIVEFDPAKAAAFAPTSDQRRLLNNIHDNPSIRTIREFCEVCDISRSTYYNWCKNPHFRLWFATAWSSRMLVEGITLLNQARAKASYKFQYWKALADLTFDPNGMALLQKWQQAMFSLDGTAFDCGPEAACEYDYHLDPTSECKGDPPPSQNPPAGVKPSLQAPVANPAENWTFQANDSAPVTALQNQPAPLDALGREPIVHVSANGINAGPAESLKASPVNQINSLTETTPKNCLTETVSNSVKAPRGPAPVPSPVAVARRFRRVLAQIQGNSNLPVLARVKQTRIHPSQPARRTIAEQRSVRQRDQVVINRPKILLARHPVNAIEARQIHRPRIIAQRLFAVFIEVVLKVRKHQLAQRAVDRLAEAQSGIVALANRAPMAVVLE